MTLTFPLSVNQFAVLLRKQSVKFFLDESVEASGVAKGDVITAQTAPDYWAADISLINMSNDDGRQIQAMFEVLGSRRTFYLFDPRCEYPVSDPGGVILGSSTVTNSEVRNNLREMKFSGLPAGYVLSAGDMFHFDFGVGNAYRALHRIVVGGTANGSGNTDWIEFTPALDDPNLNTGKTMVFVRPAAKMKILPDSYEPGAARQMMTAGMSFKCRQVP